MDLAHIEWMIPDALLVCQKEDINDSLLLPLVILHDVGYAKTPKDNPFKLDLRKRHMVEGAKIAREILEKVNYPNEKTQEICYYVSVHDNWAFGDHEYKKDRILGALKDLDFIWMITPKGFPAVRKILKKDPRGMIEYIESRPMEEGLVLTSETTKRLYKEYLNERKKEAFK